MSVWWALFVRELLQRTMADRFGWFWLLAQPILIVIVFVAIRAVILGGAARTIAGAEFIPWLVAGLLGFQMFREVVMRSLNAVEQNRKLFSYRQVKPIDPVLVRCYIEGNLNSFILVLFITASLLFEFSLLPHDPVGALMVWFALWVVGTGTGLIVSTLSVLFPEVRKIMPLIMTPLFLTSGVIFPLNFLPAQYLGWLLWNPLVHGIELTRVYFFASYQPVAGVSGTYLAMWACTLLALGLLLHLRYDQRLKTL